MDLARLLPFFHNDPNYLELIGALRPDPAVSPRPIALSLMRAARPPLLASLARVLPGPIIVMTAHAERALALRDEIAAWDPGRRTADLLGTDAGLLRARALGSAHRARAGHRARPVNRGARPGRRQTLHRDCAGPGADHAHPAPAGFSFRHPRAARRPDGGARATRARVGGRGLSAGKPGGGAGPIQPPRGNSRRLAAGAMETQPGSNSSAIRSKHCARSIRPRSAPIRKSNCCASPRRANCSPRISPARRICRRRPMRRRALLRNISFPGRIRLRAFWTTFRPRGLWPPKNGTNWKTPWRTSRNTRCSSAARRKKAAR